ncbi:hypothetical protein CEXT_380801 [Caerostris extrusa]|uniref:Uncharacterized protein n=1 Tax=Caerostris extrusa TaxID=172846 RepID=A0AAV4YDQ0_CAEEX|nr:hypothetical protein CEXT_380801 [Caerostris extrusa]
MADLVFLKDIVKWIKFHLKALEDLKIALNSELILDMVTFNTIYDEQIKQYEKSADISILKFKNNRQNALVNLSFNPLFHSKLNPSLVFKNHSTKSKERTSATKCLSAGKSSLFLLKTYTFNTGNYSSMTTKQKR